MSSHRLDTPAGAWIDRSRVLNFRFNGRALSGFAGDTLASALLANGVRLTGRSFKLHRPRGIWSCGLEEPGTLVDVGDGARYTPNVRATLMPLDEGLTARSVNCWPSVGFDLGALTGLFAPLLPAGFYYKTFKWPNWKTFEPAIRRMAGMGRAPTDADPDRYEEIAAECDVLVVGGGIAGLAAAVAAARAGAHTMLLTSGAHLGGALAACADPEVEQLASSARDLGVRILLRTLAFGHYDHNLVCACESVSLKQRAAEQAGVLRERLWKIRARAVIAAAGAFERPLVFPDNDRPGVMLAGAALKYLTAYGVACGRRVLIAAASDAAYGLAQRLRGAGLEIVAVVDRRSQGGQDADTCGLRVMTDSAVTAVFGARAVRGCAVTATAARGASRTRADRLACDLILSTAGFAPAVHLHSQAGGRLRWDESAAMFVPDGAAPGLTSVGACAGVFARASAREHAAAAGEALGRGGRPPPPPACTGIPSQGLPHAPGVRGRHFIDLQNDVTVGDVELAARENYRSVEHLKRYTTTGMGTDQGKTSNVNALLVMGLSSGEAPGQLGTTRFRPPFAPVTLGAIAGRRVGSLYRPLRELPAQAWHASHGALFETYGDWRRPAAYPLPGESPEAAAQREAAAVRQRAGLFDGSPLGKLEVFGPDAARFLDLMYVGTFSTLAVGQARYGVLLNEHGTLVDDGIVARLGPRHFWVNTTTAGAERTAAAFEEWLQCEFLNLRVLVTPVTSRWANVTVAGPRAWHWLEACGLESQLSPAAMRHMTLRESVLDGVPLRVLRASFSGELGYEVNLPADHAGRLLERLWERHEQVRATLYGIEALQVLRIEKGYLHIGTDTDGTTLPQDVGLARGIERKAEAFVGRRSLLRPVARDARRLQLVGLRPVDGRTPLEVGAHIAPHPPPGSIEGRVTSSCLSPELGHPVALALLADGSRRTGERVQVHYLGVTTAAEVVRTPFIDPAGERVHG
ncbi:MAG TPA: 2Fe-2S iron-sulfur cluster-binding protein [Steroidobacteraceae bacterium]|nr:2Fe-2S iron-sulfur cluster-binding protein [Steroidobacteraceae bacterium]